MRSDFRLTSSQEAGSQFNPGISFLFACMSIAIEEQLYHCNPRLDRAAMARMLDIVFDGLAVR